jgi:hypothetical protein
VLAATDFFTDEVLSWRGLVTYYALFFIHLESWRVSNASITDHPEACWMRPTACNATLDTIGIFTAVATFCTIAMRSSALSSARPWQPRACSVGDFLLAVQTGTLLRSVGAMG